MSRPQPPRRDPNLRATVRLRDLDLGDRESAYYGPRAGEWAVLAILVVILLANGLIIWHQLGASSDVGRAVFFGLALVALLWSALVYTLKLSVCVCVSPQGLSVVRGPWRTELAWREVARLTERIQMADGQRYRWLVALARDGRRLQVRDDMVNDYLRFRLEVWERYRLWRDHGGTWGTTSGGPFTTRERLSGQTTWWGVLAAVLTLVGLYAALLLPGATVAGWLLLALAVVSAGLSVRGALSRQTYVVDAKAIAARRLTRTIRLHWREVARVERSRHAFSGMITVGIALGRVALRLAARGDARVQVFEWSPRVPEYLTLRGAGHQIRIRLHRLERPDELLAWVEFYERVGRRVAETEAPRRSATPSRRLQPEALLPGPVPADLSGAAGPVDPWGAERAGEPLPAPALPADLPDEVEGLPAVGDTSDSWLFAEPSRAEPSAPFPPRESVLVSDAPLSGTPSSLLPQYVDPERDLPTLAAAVPPVEGPGPFGSAPWQSASDWPGSQPPEPEPPSAPPAWQPAEPGAAWVTLPYAGYQSDGDGIPDEVEPGAEEAATDAVESLAESFAPWRDEQWQRPVLPRFGPAAGPDAYHPREPGSVDEG